MAKRPIKNGIPNQFNQPRERTDATYDSMVGAFFGEYQEPANQRHIKIIYTPITAIYPDPTQPRRVIPSEVRQQWAGTPETTPQLFEAWLAAIAAERDAPEADIDLKGFFERVNTPRDIDVENLPEIAQIGSESGKTGTLESALLRVVELAASIRQEGLTNPITIVAVDGERYLIETGERRWLAYHLLHWFYGDQDQNAEGKTLDWSKIPARVVDAHSVWRQASENSARDDLNAIGKARQLALLLMHMHGLEHFQPIDAFAHEQDFYAQVADGNQYRIQRGKSELLLQATGLSHPQQLRQYRDLLRLDPELWVYADDHDLTEGAIRELRKNSDTVAIATVSRQKARSAQEPGVTYATFARKTLPVIQKQLVQMPAHDRAETISQLRALLDELERMA
ncbi:MAG: hypothetical protein OHK0046_42430 [Anaerolineae bacterium]